MAPTASLMAPKACATIGTFSSTIAVTKVTTRPISACRSETARRFSASAKAISSNAKTPSVDCSRSMMSPNPQ